MKWIDSLRLTPLLLIALFMGLAPFVPEPHLWEKLKMLFSGTLSRPIDIFDLFLHAAPLVVLTIKLIRMASAKRAHTNQS